MRSVLVILLCLGLVVIFSLGRCGFGQVLWQPQMVLPAKFDTSRPEFSRIGEQRHVLLFSKTNGYRRHVLIAATQRMFEQIAADSSWFVYATENAAIFSTQTLGEFDTVVFNNVSGPLFTLDQQAAFAAFVEAGGDVFCLHEQPTDAAYRKQLRERIRRGSQFGRAAIGRARKPGAQRSLRPVPVSPSPVPQS